MKVFRGVRAEVGAAAGTHATAAQHSTAQRQEAAPLPARACGSYQGAVTGTILTGSAGLGTGRPRPMLRASCHGRHCPASHGTAAQSLLEAVTCPGPGRQLCQVGCKRTLCAPAASRTAQRRRTQRSGTRD